MATIVVGVFALVVECGSARLWEGKEQPMCLIADTELDLDLSPSETKFTQEGWNRVLARVARDSKPAIEANMAWRLKSRNLPPRTRR